MSVLVLAAHPDDEILGAGATLALHARRGASVHAVVLTEGASSRYDDPMREALEKAGHASAACIGLSHLKWM